MNRNETAVRPARARRALAGVASLLLMLAALPAVAATGSWRPVVDGTLVDVRVLVQGQSAPLFQSWDQGQRFYFQAFQGRRYALELHNNTGERVGVLVAVDGLNVVNGERSNLRSGEAMYVLGPWETTTIRGWRSSLNDVRQFVFVDEERSYAERTGQANGDMGWIRVLTFREQRPQVWNDGRRFKLYGGAPAPEASPDERGLDAPQAQAAPPAGAKEMNKAQPEARPQDGLARGDEEGYPGTGWGDRRYDPVQRVEFRSEPYPTDQLVMRYEYASGLRALGIFPERRWRLRDRENGTMGFAQPPRW
jgi:hypothetical protein